jgi:hypothetical protein
MTVVKSQNPLIRLFQAVAEVVSEYSNNRAVNIGAVYSAVQNKLDENPIETGDGMRSGYVLDVYAEDAGVFAIITRGDGKLYKVPVSVDADSQITMGEEQEVVMDFTPVTGRQIVVKRQTDGKMRWFALPACTAVLNRSGEIDSRALFDSFVEHIERTGAYPEMDFFHMGEKVLLGKADWVARDGLLYCASGTFYDTDIARAAAASLEANPDYWGLSIAYLPTHDPEILRSVEGVEIPVFNAGINRFISLLPEDTAASIFTSISTKEEVNRMDKKMKQALEKLTNNDATLLKQFEEIIDDKNRQASLPGVINRQAVVDEPAAQTPAAPESVKTRELTIKDVVESDEFKTALSSAVKEVVTAEMESRANEPVAEIETPVAQTPVAEPEVDGVLAEIRKLTDKVEALSKTREADVASVLNDLPARIARTNIIRPRATRLPDQVNANQRTVNMADVAAATLEKMGAVEE